MSAGRLHRRGLVALGAVTVALAGLLTVSGQSANVFDLSFGNFTSGYAISSGITGGASVKFRAFAPFISSDR